jgi:hypothetical protein
MSIQLTKENANVLFFKVSGVISQEEINDTLGRFEQKVKGIASPRMIYHLEAYTSLSNNSNWSHHPIREWVDTHVEKIAIVGPEELRASASLYFRMGLREASIRYFEPEYQEPLSRWISSNDY